MALQPLEGPTTLAIITNPAHGIYCLHLPLAPEAGAVVTTYNQAGGTGTDESWYGFFD